MTRTAVIALAFVGGMTTLAALAQQAIPGGGGGPAFTLTSPAMTDGAPLPADLRCTRNGGDGASPPLDWANAPAGTKAYAIVMQHYPKDTYPGIDAPSHYWLVWNIPGDAMGVRRGNPDHLGVAGGDKDMRATGYTPPCSPTGAGTHEYTIWAYALDGPLADLPAQDDISTDWSDVMAALKGHVLAGSSITFLN